MIEALKLKIRLKSLRQHFDSAMLHGSSFEEVIKIYIEIKEIEKQLAVNGQSEVKTRLISRGMSLVSSISRQLRALKQVCMFQDLSIRGDDELRRLSQDYQTQLLNGIDDGYSFDTMKELRVKMRQVNNEIELRETKVRNGH